VSPVLDNQEKIKSIDKGNMLSFCVDIARHYEKAAAIANAIKISYPKPENIIVVGMGGSAIGGDLLKDWAKNKSSVPIEVNRDYYLPAYANEKTLVLITSYSGETEESLSAFLDALKRKCMVYCITSGGTLLDYAQRLNVPYLRVPGGMPPRAALPYLLVPLLVCMEKLQLVSGASQELDEALAVLGQVARDNSPNKPAKENLSKTLASSLEGTVPVVYGFGIYRSVAQRFKQQFNENSKLIAKWDFFPEIDHNEVVGWEKAEDFSSDFSAIFIRDRLEPLEIRSRIETTKQLMQPSGLKIYEIYCQGRSDLAKMLSTVCIGDFISIYLAIQRGIDPTPVKTITSLKEALKKNGVREKIIVELGKMMP
jgi:glucose/mannose-6-phosphate isomerase